MGLITSLASWLSRGESARPAAWDDAKVWLANIEHHSGYQREASVQALQRLRHGPAVPALLRRANDWVPEVREAARAALSSLLVEEFEREWIAALESIAGLARAQRDDHAALLEAISSFLCSPQRWPAVVLAAKLASAPVRRFVQALEWRQLQDEGGRFQWLRAALAGDDVRAVRLALNRIDSVESVQRRAALAGAACCSPFAPVRAEGLRLALLAPAPETPDLVRAMCLDASALVRGIAWGALSEPAQRQAVIAKAVAQLGTPAVSGSSQAAALQLLCTVAPEVARAHCHTSRDASSAAVRRVALQALLEGSEEAECESLLLSAFADPSARVQRLVVDGARRGGTVPAVSRIMEIALGHGTPQALSRAFAIVSHSSPWVLLQCLLDARLALAWTAGAEVCEQALVRWEKDSAKSYVWPTQAQALSLRLRWGRVAALLPVPLRERIGFHLRMYKLEET